MSVMNKAPAKFVGVKPEPHRNTVSIRVDARTVIEVSAHLTPEQRKKRVDDFIRNRGQRFVR